MSQAQLANIPPAAVSGFSHDCVFDWGPARTGKFDKSVQSLNLTLNQLINLSGPGFAALVSSDYTKVEELIHYVSQNNLFIEKMTQEALSGVNWRTIANFKVYVQKHPSICQGYSTKNSVNAMTWLQVACSSTTAVNDLLKQNHCTKDTSSDDQCSLPAMSLMGLQPGEPSSSVQLSTLCITQLRSLLPDTIQSLSGAQWADLGTKNLFNLGPHGVRDLPLSFIHKDAVASLTDDQWSALGRYHGRAVCLGGSYQQYKCDF